MNDRALLDLVICRIPGVSVRERVLLCTKFEKEAEITTPKLSKIPRKHLKKRQKTLFDI